KENWQEIIPEQGDTISFVDIFDHSLVVTTMHHAYEKLAIYSLDGELRKQVPLPDFISIIDIAGKKTDSEMFLNYTSILDRSRINRYDFEADELEMIFEEGLATGEASEFETKQIFYTSKDGTKVPMFITHKKGIELTGDHTVLLFGYGGCNFSFKVCFFLIRKSCLVLGGL